MVTVYAVQEPGGQVTRLYLPASEWGQIVRFRLDVMGYSVQATGQEPHPDPRDADELARRDALLEWASPD